MSVEFNISEFVLDDSAVGSELEGFSVYLPAKMPFTLSVFADTKYHTTVNLVYGKSRSVSLWSPPDCRVLSPMNLFYR